MVGNESVRSADALQQAVLNPAVQLDLVNQQVFTGHIEGIRKTDTFRLPDLTPYMSHDGQISSDLEIHFDGQGDRVFLSDNFYKYVEHDVFPDRLSFNVQNILRMGRENSRRQVFFGLLRANWFNAADTEARQIAVTPIPSEEKTSGYRNLAFHEIAMYQQLGRLGISTLDILGVSVFEEPKSDVGGFLVTRLVPNLVPLDTLEWNTMETEEVDQYLGIALDTAADLNSELQFHGDLRFKNVCFGEGEGNAIVADLEFGTSARDVPENISLLGKLMSREFARIRESVAEFIIKNLPSGQKPQDDIERFDFMHNHVYEPYFERLIHIGGPYIDVLPKAYDLVMRQQQAIARGDSVPAA